MSIDNLITIGIILYVVVSVIRAISSGKKKAETESPDGTDQKKAKKGWADKLGDFIEEVKDELEKAHQESRTQPPEPFEDDDDVFWDEPEPVRDVRQTVSYDQHPVPPKPVILDDSGNVPPIPEPETESHRNFHGTHDRPGKVYDHCDYRPAFKIRKADLKKAVIWSEIISKPVGLRDE